MSEWTCERFWQHSGFKCFGCFGAIFYCACTETAILDLSAKILTTPLDSEIPAQFFCQLANSRAYTVVPCHRFWQTFWGVV